MAAGINYNNVWAGARRRRSTSSRRARATRTGPTSRRSTSAAATPRASSGRSAAPSRNVEGRRPGRHPLRHVEGRRPEREGRRRSRCSARRFRIWGYETNWGSFAQFTRVQAHQCLPEAEAPARGTRPRPTCWSGATAYRMLMSWPPHTVQHGDVVLVWGGAGGLGCQAIQIAKARGRHAGRRHLERRQGRVLQEARRQGHHQPQEVLPLGHAAALEGRREAYGEWAEGRARLRRGALGGGRRAQEPAHRLRAPGRGHRPDLDLRVRHGRHGRHLRRHDRLQRRRSTCATSGCGRSASRARTSPTTTTRGR